VWTQNYSETWTASLAVRQQVVDIPGRDELCRILADGQGRKMGLATLDLGAFRASQIVGVKAALGLIAWSLPLCVGKAKRLCVLGDCALGLVLGSVGEVNLYLDADFDLGVRVAAQDGNDFFGDLDETHFGCGGRYVG
jgi:hypothetical protein